MPDKPNHPARTRTALEVKTPAGTVGNSAFGLGHMPTLPRPQTSVIIPATPVNHLEQHLSYIPNLRNDDGE